ncbi:glycosyltransferase [Foetidibacter luteolus]|uniref:glycosyltransferase n=1 Tax=Foetidibacter luteolus TaxID=2608880 RepID=UPI00129B0207|nr:glycosyltransferase [Foetidibacter luteolus]
MKIAIVHDELVRRGGGEQVALSMHKAFPDAPVYTLCYDPAKTYPEFKKAKVVTSWFQKIGSSEKLIKMLYFPFAILAMRSIKLKGYDVVLISTTHCGKFIRTDKKATVITYCHTPFRFAFRPHSYESVANSNWLVKRIFLTASWILRSLDRAATENTDWFITNARQVVERIKNAYHPSKPVTVINPPVNLDNFYITDTVKDYYLVVCRLEAYKKVDLVIEAFNSMPNRKLIVVGKGSMEEALHQMAAPNTTFQHSLNAKQLATLYAECKALIFPQYEDYGITPLEAAASGRPVIAFGQGGVLETMIPYKDNSKTATAVFFNSQTPGALTDAINEFEQLSFDPYFIRRHAEKFEEVTFIQKLKEFIYSKTVVPMQVAGKAQISPY